MFRNTVFRITVYIIFLSTLLLAQSGSKIDSLLNIAKDYNKENMREIYNKLNSILDDGNSETAKRDFNKILKYLSKLEDKSLYIRLYLDSEFFYTFPKKITIFNRAYKMADSIGNENLMGNALMMKAFAFRNQAMTDSAMISALKAKALFEKTGNKYDLVYPKIIIADLHYYARHFSKAEKLYNEVLELKGDPVQWNSWIYSMVLDDLGLLRIKQKRYAEAEEYFTKSKNFVFSKKLQHSDSLRLTYIFWKLAEVNFLRNNYIDAENFYQKAMNFAERYNQLSELAGINIVKGKLLFATGKYDSALVFLKKAEKYESISPDVEHKTELYQTFSNTYKALNDNKNAYYYFELLRNAEKTADSLFDRANYMTLYAENNYENYLDEISDYKSKQIVMIIFIILILSSLTVFTFFYIKLRTANKKVVQKNIELVKGYHTGNGSDEINVNNHVNSNSDTSIATLGEDLCNQIIEKLENLMKTEKIFLKPEISLEELAVRLETNRAYLSRAINSKYKMNFNNYINASRIKEAIKFISNGDLKTFTLEGIAQTVGFNNRVSFNKAFHKYTGVTPSFFIKNAEKFT